MFSANSGISEKFLACRKFDQISEKFLAYPISRELAENMSYRVVWSAEHENHTGFARERLARVLRASKIIIFFQKNLHNSSQRIGQQIWNAGSRSASENTSDNMYPIPNGHFDLEVFPCKDL